MALWISRALTPIFQLLETLPGRVRAAYRVSVNEFNDLKRPRLTLESVEPAAPG